MQFVSLTPFCLVGQFFSLLFVTPLQRVVALLGDYTFTLPWLN